MPQMVYLNLLFRPFSVVNDNMKDPKPHFFESGTFVWMPWIKYPSRKIKNSLVHRWDFQDFVTMVQGMVKSMEITKNPGLQAGKIFLAFFSRISIITLNGPEIIPNVWIWDIYGEIMTTRGSPKSGIFIGFPPIWVDFLYTEYTECKKVVGYKNAFFWKVP